MADGGIVVRPETPADHEAIRRVVAAAFESDAEADLVEAIRASPEYVAELSLVAIVGDAVVGHVMLSGALLRTAEGDRPITMLAPLAVDPVHQRRGIGGALVHEAIAIADRLGEPCVVLQGDPGYYGRLGFEAAGPLGIEMGLPDWAPPEAAQVRRLSAYDPTLCGDVIEPPAFDAH